MPWDSRSRSALLGQQGMSIFESIRISRSWQWPRTSYARRGRGVCCTAPPLPPPAAAKCSGAPPPCSTLLNANTLQRLLIFGVQSGFGIQHPAPVVLTHLQPYMMAITARRQSAICSAFTTQMSGLRFSQPWNPVVPRTPARWPSQCQRPSAGKRWRGLPCGRVPPQPLPSRTPTRLRCSPVHRCPAAAAQAVVLTFLTC